MTLKLARVAKPDAEQVLRETIADWRKRAATMLRCADEMELALALEIGKRSAEEVGA